MGADIKHPLDKQIADVGARMLFQGGVGLLRSLRSEGMLSDVRSGSGKIHQDCAQLSKILRYFVQTVYVLVRKPGHAPHACHPGPLCTCVCFCRYCGCEHVEYVKFLDLRLQKATYSADALPELKRRGRKRGVTMTQRAPSEGSAKKKKREYNSYAMWESC